MKVAVTGAAGQLGRELCRQFGDIAVPLVQQQLDITDAGAVRSILAELKPDGVVNCAAYTAVDRAEQDADRCYAVNAAAVDHLADACRTLDCPLVQISTDYVFAGSPSRNTPFHEDEPASPRGVYAKSKWAGEQAAAAWKKHLIVRTCGLYARASDRDARNFARAILHRATSGEPLRVVADQRCTPSFAPHVARAVCFLLDIGRGVPAPWGTYHVTNAGATTWYEFAVELLRRAGIRAEVTAITTAEYGALAPRPAYSVLDTTRYRQLGGPELPPWQAALDEYLPETVEYPS